MLSNLFERFNEWSAQRKAYRRAEEIVAGVSAANRSKALAFALNGEDITVHESGAFTASKSFAAPTGKKIHSETYYHANGVYSSSRGFSW